MTRPATSAAAGNAPLLLSVIVPTEGRLRSLTALVASFREAWRIHVQSTSESRSAAEVIELVFVDSTEPALDPSAIDAWDLSWMHVRRGTQNVRQKRNQGAAQARGQWIAFVDSDCLVTPGYLSAVLVAIERGQAQAFAGRVEFRGAENAVWRVVAASQLVSPESQTAGEGEVEWCATANLIVERSLFVALGGFDESLPFRLGGDDVDFGLRLRRNGSPLHVLPDALVVHPKAPWSELSGILARTWRWGRVEYHLAVRHPDKLRQTPPFFMGAILTFALASVLGTVLTSRPALLLTLPLWIAASSLLSTLLTGWKSQVPFRRRYMAGWLERVYHLGSVWEHVRAGSPRFLWQGFILQDRLEDLFPVEPLQSWAYLVAALLVGLAGAAIVAR